MHTFLIYMQNFGPAIDQQSMKGAGGGGSCVREGVSGGRLE